jgi:hypothetical protein
MLAPQNESKMRGVKCQQCDAGNAAGLCRTFAIIIPGGQMRRRNDASAGQADRFVSE